MIVDNSVLLPTTVTVVILSVWIIWNGVFKVSGFLDSIGDLTLAASPEVSKRSLSAFFCSQAKVFTACSPYYDLPQDPHSLSVTIQVTES